MGAGDEPTGAKVSRAICKCLFSERAGGRTRACLPSRRQRLAATGDCLAGPAAIERRDGPLAPGRAGRAALRPRPSRVVSFTVRLCDTLCGSRAGAPAASSAVTSEKARPACGSNLCQSS
jgi:hypothetical protein